MDKMQENNTIKPPIKSNVEIEEVIELAKISPRLEIVVCLDDILNELVFKCSCFISFFQNLKRKPTINEAKMCEMNKSKPIVVL